MLFVFLSDGILENIVKNRDHFDLQTTIELALFLKYAVRMILETLPFCDQITHPLMHEVMNTLIQTFGSSTSNELIAACLGKDFDLFV